MAIPTIGIQPTLQYTSRTGEPRGSAAKENQSGGNQLKNETQPVTSNNGGVTQTTTTKVAVFSPVPETVNASKTTSSRRDPAQLETFRNSFQLQKENNNLTRESGKALKSFADVAEFERKDEFANRHGIDIFI